MADVEGRGCDEREISRTCVVDQQVSPSVVDQHLPVPCTANRVDSATPFAVRNSASWPRKTTLEPFATSVSTGMIGSITSAMVNVTWAVGTPASSSNTLRNHLGAPSLCHFRHSCLGVPLHDHIADQGMESLKGESETTQHNWEP